MSTHTPGPWHIQKYNGRVYIADSHGAILAGVAISFGGGLALLILFTLFVWAPIAAHTEQQCLSLGWKDYKVAWNLERYCIREENEYEITKALKEIRRD